MKLCFAHLMENKICGRKRVQRLVGMILIKCICNTYDTYIHAFISEWDRKKLSNKKLHRIFASPCWSVKIEDARVGPLFTVWGHRKKRGQCRGQGQLCVAGLVLDKALEQLAVSRNWRYGEEPICLRDFVFSFSVQYVLYPSPLSLPENFSKIFIFLLHFVKVGRLALRGSDRVLTVLRGKMQGCLRDPTTSGVPLRRNAPKY